MFMECSCTGKSGGICWTGNESLCLYKMDAIDSVNASALLKWNEKPEEGEERGVGDLPGLCLSLEDFVRH